MRRSFETSTNENGYWLAQLVSTYRDDGDPSEILDYLETLDTITQESVREAANTYFDLDNYVQVVLLPEEGVVR
jgi:zinc protease